MNLMEIHVLSTNEKTNVSYLVKAFVHRSQCDEDLVIREIDQIISQLEKLGARVFEVHQLDD